MGVRRQGDLSQPAQRHRRHRRQCVDHRQDERDGHRPEQLRRHAGSGQHPDQPGQHLVLQHSEAGRRLLHRADGLEERLPLQHHDEAQVLRPGPVPGASVRRQVAGQDRLPVVAQLRQQRGSGEDRCRPDRRVGHVRLGLRADHGLRQWRAGQQPAAPDQGVRFLPVEPGVDALRQPDGDVGCAQELPWPVCQQHQSGTGLRHVLPLLQRPAFVAGRDAQPVDLPAEPERGVPAGVGAAPPGLQRDGLQRA